MKLNSPGRFAWPWLLALLITSGLAKAQSVGFRLAGQLRDTANAAATFSGHWVHLEHPHIDRPLGPDGSFQFSGLAQGHYHLQIHVLGYAPQRLHVELTTDTFVVVPLAPAFEELDEVVVVGGALQRLDQAEVSGALAGAELAGIVQKLPGLSVISNGGGMAVPVYHGLFGNRLPVVNNGVAVYGQQWGLDHSPEVDPMAAGSVKVLSGPEALSQSGGAVGGALLLSAPAIARSPHPVGSLRTQWHSNGRGGTVRMEVQSGSERAQWRVGSTLSGAGDQHSPDYLLRNTGRRAWHLDGTWNGTVAKGQELQINLRSYRAELGVLRGSHIGNLTDLESALVRTEPFFTTDTFSYAIEAPRQVVAHYVGDVRYKRAPNKQRLEQWQWSVQHNVRKEFDVRRSGRSAVPALHMALFTQEARYSQGWGDKDNERLLLGAAWLLKKNTNDAETGILPLIPNYLSHQAVAFARGQFTADRATLAWGIRYEGTQRAVAAISRTVPREVVFYSDQFHALSAAWTYKRSLGQQWTYTLEGQWNERAPQPNELYSFGLHQGVSGIEEGNPGLKKEQGASQQVRIAGTPSPWLRIEAAAYLQHYLNYIYLQPKQEYRLTIRGAFPVFEYRQAAAQIAGAEGTLYLKLSNDWLLQSQWALLHGTNLDDGLPLVYMPPGKVSSTLRHTLPNWGPLEHLNVGVEHAFTAEQKRWDATLDFAPPPPAYHLWHLTLNGQWHSAGSRPQWELRINNVMNTAYRDYMNRLRYFADDLGRNVQLGLRWNF